MALNEKSQPRKPRGPERDSSKYTTSPTTTDGTAKNVFKQASTTPWPLKRATPSHAPNSKPSAQASRQAVALTHKERPTMASKVGSSDKTNWKAVVKLSANVFMNALS